MCLPLECLQAGGKANLNLVMARSQLLRSAISLFSSVGRRNHCLGRYLLQTDVHFANAAFRSALFDLQHLAFSHPFASPVFVELCLDGSLPCIPLKFLNTRGQMALFRLEVLASELQRLD